MPAPDGNLGVKLNESRSLANLRPAWRRGESGNTRGRPKRSAISQRIRELLARDADLLDAVKVLRSAGVDVDEWDAQQLTNVDLVAMSILGIALNRSGQVQQQVQLAATKLVWSYIDGKPSGKSAKALDEESRPRITAEDFREAMGLVPPDASANRK